MSDDTQTLFYLLKDFIALGDQENALMVAEKIQQDLLGLQESYSNSSGGGFGSNDFQDGYHNARHSCAEDLWDLLGKHHNIPEEEFYK